MLLLAGLGNPGPRYASNRHNIGFMAVDRIVRRHAFGPWRRRFQANWSEGRVGGAKVFCLKPQTFMNHSGRSLGEAVRFYKLPLESLMVLHDDLDLASGKIRVKTGGGNGGHNGLRSIDAHLGTAYRRLRIGIGHPGDKDLVQGYVLKDFAKSEQTWVDPLLDALAEELPRLVTGDDPGFMSRIALLAPPPKPNSESRGPDGPATRPNPSKES